MNMDVQKVNISTTQVVPKDLSKPPKEKDPSQTATTESSPSASITTPSPQNHDPQKDRYTVLKECRDWVNSGLVGVTLAVGLMITFSSFSKSNIKDLTKVLASNDANLKEVIGALGEHNKQVKEVILQNNETVKGAIAENTRYLAEVVKVLDKNGDGNLTPDEIEDAKMLLEQARTWKRFTDAINEATKKQ